MHTSVPLTSPHAPQNKLAHSHTHTHTYALHLQHTTTRHAQELSRQDGSEGLAAFLALQNPSPAAGIARLFAAMRPSPETGGEQQLRGLASLLDETTFQGDQGLGTLLGTLVADGRCACAPYNVVGWWGWRSWWLELGLGLGLGCCRCTLTATSGG